MKLLRLIIILFLLCPLASFAEDKGNILTVFDQATDLITHNFYDQTFRGVPWKVMVERARKRLKPTSSDAKLEKVLNELLDQLHASHTEFLSSSDQEYWALESVFSGDVDGAPLYQIGAWFIRDQGRWFVRNVFEGSPAASAGLLPGDEVVSVNGHSLEPVESFIKEYQHPFSLRTKRSEKSKIQTLFVKSVHESFQRTLLRGAEASYKVFDICGKKIGYFHLWAGTNDESMNALADAAKKAAQETDSLVLDLRDGFGGAYPAYLNPFFDHDDQGKPTLQVYSKPMVALINGGVRSGKEWVADILKQTKRATLIGTQTRGYFLAGKVFPVVPGRFDLYLAVAKGPGPDLEGNGVRPDIRVALDLPYSSGIDPQLKRGLSFLSGSDSKGTCK